MFRSGIKKKPPLFNESPVFPSTLQDFASGSHSVRDLWVRSTRVWFLTRPEFKSSWNKQHTRVGFDSVNTSKERQIFWKISILQKRWIGRIKNVQQIFTLILFNLWFLTFWSSNVARRLAISCRKFLDTLEYVATGWETISWYKKQKTKRLQKRIQTFSRSSLSFSFKFSSSLSSEDDCQIFNKQKHQLNKIKEFSSLLRSFYSTSRFQYTQKRGFLYLPFLQSLGKRTGDFVGEKSLQIHKNRFN